ncbi:GPW/gp25 family protein [Streptomyces sp. NPDC006197]|uniref:GPW/gp25 family protein n=1 Tax=Streptomyces sp. NPDC006197 TaxID=3156685 RepID=UPI0033A8C7B4
MAGGFGFPFGVNASGSIAPEPDEDHQLRGKIIHVLFTAPGERLNQPDFGCGLLNLVFEPNNTILAAAVEFTVGQALGKWLGDELVVEDVEVQTAGEAMTVEVGYIRRRDFTRRTVRVTFR